MSKRRAIGDVFIKRENAGFVGSRMYGKIPQLPENSKGERSTYGCHCILDCGDRGCIEWPTILVADSLEELDKEGCGIACHVSECEMEDV